jgi:hypothetical protein
MKRLLFTLVLGIAAPCLAIVVQARPFTDPRSDRIEALDNTNSNDPRDQACYAKTFVSTGGTAPRFMVIRDWGKGGFLRATVIAASLLRREARLHRSLLIASDAFRD